MTSLTNMQFYIGKRHDTGRQLHFVLTKNKICLHILSFQTKRHQKKHKKFLIISHIAYYVILYMQIYQQCTYIKVHAATARILNAISDKTAILFVLNIHKIFTFYSHV